MGQGKRDGVKGERGHGRRKLERVGHDQIVDYFNN